jgi:putative nucleotidyltransferase with HDIG domain
MPEETCLVDVADLRVGMFVHLDLGWTAHPFPRNSFRIRSESQIRTLRSLGLQQIRCSPEPIPPAAGTEDAGAGSGAAVPLHRDPDTRREIGERQRRRQQLAEQRASLATCERQFDLASRQYRTLQKNLATAPGAARDTADAIVAALLGELAADGEVTLRLLSEKALADSSLHPINVALICLLLGRALDLDPATLEALTLGALLHDIGKGELPERLHWGETSLSLPERVLYRRHVGFGVSLGQRLNLPAAALAAIAEHHECSDGSGYPRGLAGAGIHLTGRAVAIVNHFDNLCNPGHPAQAMTPHDALAQMFARTRERFDSAVMAVFIRMMGVYPPGSVVRLSDDRYALVTTVNPLRPLKPQVILYDPQIPREDALIVDLERQAELGIQRCLSPLQLPRRVFEYLSPRKRICYYFERAREPGGHGDPS